jgi:ribonuclease HII
MFVPIEIIDDSDNETQQQVEPIKKERKPRVKHILNKFYNENPLIIDIGVDEAGRGPLFGRVYAAAAVLPKDDSFNHSLVKDSKKFSSKRKLFEVYEYIKQNAIAYCVAHEDETIIDDINILQATQSAMHKAIHGVLQQLGESEYFLVIDGNYFKPLVHKDKTLKFHTIEGGDNKYTCIAAASILAKVERDQYIDNLCIQNPELVERYGLDTNKGYGAKKHIEGIKQYGITPWHRRSFGICKEFA